MDPGVISDWPSKCGVCNMALVRRKRGEAVSLPDGVVARMQLSPNRIQLAGHSDGARVIPPLEREYECAGLVTIDHGAGGRGRRDSGAARRLGREQGRGSRSSFRTWPAESPRAGRFGA